MPYKCISVIMIFHGTSADWWVLIVYTYLVANHYQILHIQLNLFVCLYRLCVACKKPPVNQKQVCSQVIKDQHVCYRIIYITRHIPVFIVVSIVFKDRITTHNKVTPNIITFLVNDYRCVNNETFYEANRTLFICFVVEYALI